MPSKHIIKQFVADGHYHLYNRGVNKQPIFADNQDYRVLLSYLKIYLSPPPKIPLTHQVNIKDNTFTAISRPLNNYHNQISLLAYCLMPNHYHFLVKQSQASNISEFIRSVFTKYSTYFNKRHSRVGTLFQSRFKAILVNHDEYLLHLSRYIHLNPAKPGLDLTKAFSSYADYLGLKNTSWVNPRPILDYLSSPTSPTMRHSLYKHFVQDSDTDSPALLEDLTID